MESPRAKETLDSHLDTGYSHAMTSPDARRGQSIGTRNETDWSRRRLAANLSITELAKRSNIARSLVGLIDQGRLLPTPNQASAILAVLDAASEDVA